ncbi:hypothetical protein [Pseudothioclava nitratireducens]|uniref:hypothetical protein n=1 Tax=Pseudothioclava nitratireducens TaxID=1928646 RepID=UPI0023DA1D54|nr:hypothetical protein [Defluviimonas nitratireducens]MDF1620300.1 hypothetical protein [Defluviimonas nitratireducens]
MHQAFAQRIARLFYNAARRRFEGVVEFFAPGLPEPMRVPVTLEAPEGISHGALTRSLLREAQRRGIGGI